MEENNITACPVIAGWYIMSRKLEKMRPAQKPFIYGKGSYIDTVSPVSKGELSEYSK